MDDEKKKAVVSLFQDAAKPVRKPRAPRTPKSGNVITIRDVGQGAQVAGGDIHNHYTVPARPAKVVVTPGDGVITEAQKVELTELRQAWMDLHQLLKKNPLSHVTTWSRINKAGRATSYHLITQENFPKAVAFIKTEMAKLRNMASAPAKDPAWRTSKIGGIKARCKKQLGDEFAYVPYIKKNFGKTSLTELATDELQRTYAYIMAKKAP